MDTAIIHIQKNLDAIKRVGQDLEYWSARDLMHILGYIKWQKFAEVLEKAKESCRTSGRETADHFTGAGKMVLTGSGARRNVEDMLLLAFRTL